MMGKGVSKESLLRLCIHCVHIETSSLWAEFVNSVLEKVWDHGRSLLEVRESKYIRDFMTELRGMNRKK